MFWMHRPTQILDSDHFFNIKTNELRKQPFMFFCMKVYTTVKWI